PTPSGYLHRGNAFSFVLTWLLVRHAGGQLLLRIDDADTVRARSAYLEDIFRSLGWLGLDWDAGPSGPTDFTQKYSQAIRFPVYLQLLEDLRRQGSLYACSCSRSQLRQQASKGLSGDVCRDLALSFSNPDYAWRIKVPDSDICFQEKGIGSRCLPLASQMGDFVVKRKGGLPAYQLASLSDDMYWGINFIVRGEDLLYSTAAQVYLAQQLNAQEGGNGHQQAASLFTAATFLHHPLLLDEKGEKLSKSAGSTSLKSLREAGGNPLSIYAQVASYLKLPADAAASLEDMLGAMREF
ncbi:MAG: glutamate--tRNA ligase, partial [Bacteroidetes bacterium]|nr:glutamate--tRNA ligase [Bacteroidota bacterium]